MSRAHLEQGRVRAPPGEGSAPRGRRGAMWGGGSSTSPTPHVGARLAVSVTQAAVSVQRGSPAAWCAARLGERADPRASGSEQASTVPSAAAPRALTPLPVFERSETGAVTRPENDGMAGPIKRCSGSLGGGAEAGRLPRGAGSLREALPRGGPGGGQEGRGSRRREAGGVVAGRAVRTAVESQGARQRAGFVVGELILRWPLARVRQEGGCS